MEVKHYYAIITVGTSILKNASGDKEFDEKCNNPLGEECLDYLYKKLLMNPRKMSAEINTIWDYLNSKSIKSVTLLASETDEGKASAKVLQRYFRSMGTEADITVVEKLGTAFEVGTVNLMDAISKSVKEGKKHGLSVLLNLTGGYKAESAMAYLSALLLGIEKILYMHETLKHPVELPSVPIELKKSVAEKLSSVADSQNCIQWLSMGMSQDELLELKDRGVVEESGALCRVREIVKELIEIYKNT